MNQDHYAVLGVAPSAEPSEIRAAYRALMRKFHPDADSGNEAAERAREINAAYAILNNAENRNAYDATLSEHRQIRFEPNVAPPAPAPVRKRVAAAGAMLIAVLAAGMIGYAVYPSIRPPSSTAIQSVVEAPRDLAAAKPPPQAESACAGPSLNDAIKEELFRRAAERRPEVGAQLRQVAASTVARFSAKESGRAGDCSGWLSLDIPTDVAVEGGRTNLNADIAFDLTQAGPSLRLAALKGADRVVQSLASLGPAPREPSAVEIAQVETVVRTTPQRAAPQVAARTASKAAPTSAKPATMKQAEAATPCSGLAGRTERLICDNANLASLDRQLSSFYRQSWNQADEQKRSALLRTRQSFNDRRDGCSSPNCLTVAYTSRLRQISEIMAGRVQP